MAAKKAKTAEVIRLDLGCGTNKRPGFLGVDCRKFPGVDLVLDLAKRKWPWQTSSVEEVWCSHMVEHLKPAERIHFVNELHRVLKKDGKAVLVTPNWSSCRAYGDLTHQWPPVSEFWFPYLSKEWRKTQAPHNDRYTCDFTAVPGHAMHPALLTWAEERQAYALSWFKEAGQDLLVTLTAVK